MAGVKNNKETHNKDNNKNNNMNKVTAAKKSISKKADKYPTTIIASVFFILALLLCIGMHFEYKEEIRIKENGTVVTAYVSSVQRTIAYKEDGGYETKFEVHIEWQYDGEMHTAIYDIFYSDSYYKAGDEIKIIVDRNDGGKWCTAGDSGYRILKIFRVGLIIAILALIYSIIYDVRNNKDKKNNR